MIHGQSAETLARKNSGSRNYHCGLSLPHSPCRLLLRPGATRHHNRCCDNNCRVHCLQDLEAQARFQLVEKEGFYG